MPAMNELVNEHHFVARCTHMFPLDHKVMKDICCAYRPQFLGAIGVVIVAPAGFPAATGTLHYLCRIVGVTKDNRITLWAMDLAIHGIRNVEDALAARIERVANLINQVVVKNALSIQLV
jgi:hypothetical protein